MATFLNCYCYAESFILQEKFNREYKDESEELVRKQIFRENLNVINRHNIDYRLGRSSYTMGVNQFADLTVHEFAAQMNGYKQELNVLKKAHRFHHETKIRLPDSVDWRTHNPPVVTPIKNQEQCGSCWAFSAVASLEGQHALAKSLVSLSEQNLVDCSQPEGNLGCGGGLMDQAFQYVIDAGGLDTEKSYPYEGVDDSCRFNKKNVGATLVNYTDIQSGSESALQHAVATVGPISVAIDASQMSFQLYESGVYNEPDCSSSMLDHGVTAVGYGTQNGQDYWLVKNSWGTSWGQKGYILMSRNKNNQCGIATQASYPNVK